MTKQEIKRLPYGVADYRRLRQDNSYYVDKTRFIPLLEAMPYYLFFIRPRRFGKSLWLSVLQHYYDLNFKDQFEALFGETYIGQQPTKEHHTYLVMMFNFSLVNPDLHFVHESFEDYGRTVVESFVRRYERFFDEDEQQDILNSSQTEGQLRRIFFYAGQ